jgi:hypothetical protein
VLSLQVFCACWFHSSLQLRSERDFARCRGMREASRIIGWHLRMRGTAQLWCLSQAASMPRVARGWRWLAGVVS